MYSSRAMLEMDLEDFEGSDLVRFVALYKSVGIDLIADECVDIFFKHDPVDNRVVDRATILLSGDKKIVASNIGAFSEINFKADGSFDYQEIGVE